MNSGNSKTSGSNRFILNQKDKISDLITISLHQTLVFSLKKLKAYKNDKFEINWDIF